MMAHLFRLVCCISLYPEIVNTKPGFYLKKNNNKQTNTHTHTHTHTHKNKCAKPRLISLTVHIDGLIY